MFAHIRHVALYTENYRKTVTFYERVLGMKKITSGMPDENGQPDPNRGHISDGVIGLAPIQRHPGARSGLDHFGFEVADTETVLKRVRQDFPEVRIARSLDFVPFSVMRITDPAGTHIDISQRGNAKVREGYLEDGWEQPRHLSHIAIRAARPTAVARFYESVFEMKPMESPPQHTICLTDGKIRLLILPCEDTSYRSMTEGLDHVGFKVENIEQVKSDLDELRRTFPDSAPRKLDLGRFGSVTKRELEACILGRYALSDPDGVLLDLTE